MRSLLAATALAAVCRTQDVKPSAKMINGGTPPGVPATFDCKARAAAWEYGKHLLPERGDFKTLFEALQLQDCNLPTPAEMDVFKPESFPTPSGALFVDPIKGSDKNDGAQTSPFKTIVAAVAAAGAKQAVLLRAGNYYTDTVQVTKKQSGLTIQNYNGEEVIVSGGTPLSIAKSAWKPDPKKPGRFVANLTGMGIKEITGLRRDGQRSIRAKYPNGNMELSGNWLSGSSAGMGGGDYTKGWVPLSNHTQWVPPFRHDDSEDVIANDSDWPSVDWPHYVGSQTGEGDKGDYHIGVGGYCQDDLQDPLTGPTGYWCAMAPPRGQCWNKEKNQGRGCTQTHMRPDGMVLDRAAHYEDPTTAVVLSWRGGGRWFSQMWKVDHFVKENTTLIFDPTTGGQGGEGMTTSGQWWIENVLEECDSAEEFYFDEKTEQLYYFFNTTGIPDTADWVATKTRVLFNITGTMAEPVTDVTIRGLTMRDTRITYLDPHGMPSGGDWGLQRSGAIFLQGTERCVVEGNAMIRLDGNAVFLSAYNRNTTIAKNDVSWNGDTVFAAWGITGKCVNEKCDRKLDWPVGPDGRNGEQPRGTRVMFNMVREIGIWQKQSSMWFQAVTAQSHLVGNVHFNGPRAGLNFNDGFGGADVIEHNLLANCVRESGDHGPWNSWDRIPYITDVFDTLPETLPPIKPHGKASVVPAWRHIRRNFIMSVYSSQEAIDTDDGSAYYQTYENFFAFAANGLKSDFNGHDNRHFRNVYGYVDNCWGFGDKNWFVNNTCVANSPDGGFRSDCEKKDMENSGNTIYNAKGILKGTKICDPTNKVEVTPSDDDIIALGKKAIGWTTGH